MATAPINTTTQEGISPYASSYVTDILARTKALSETPYTPYTGNRVAGFDPLQRQAFEGIGSLAGYTPYIYDDQNPYLTSAMGEIGNIRGADPYQYTRQSFADPGQMQQFMSPYQQGVTDIAAREARRSSDIAAQAENALAAQRGAFGGSRSFIMGAERARNLQQQLGDIQTRGLQSAFETAQRQFNTEAAAEQQRQQLQDIANRFGYTTGVDAAGKRLSAAERMQDVEQRRDYLQDLSNRYGYTSGIEALKLKEAAGMKKQALEQKGLDIDYENVERQRKYPYENLDFAKKMLADLPLKTTSVTGEVPKTDWLSTIGGIGGLLAKNPDAVKNILGNLGGSGGGISDFLSSLFGGGGGGYGMPNVDEALRYLDSDLTGFY